MRLLLLLALPALLAGPALTGANAVPVTTGGLGSATISGYVVSSIEYTVDDETVEAVSFRLAPATAQTVRARLATTLPWTACALAAGAVSCPVETPVDVALALEVVAAD
jgi:hypothetical protein